MNKYENIGLSNGSKLILVPEKDAKTATALLLFKTGSRNENRENNGISHFLEHMFFKGSKNYSNTLALSSAFDALGCEFNAFTGKEYTGYYVKVAASNLEKVLTIFSDMMLNPKLESKEIEREKGVIIEELKMYEDNPMMHIDDVLENCLFGDTPVGWDTIGTKENIRCFKRKDFVNYLEKQYCASAANLVLAGAVSGQALKKGKALLSAFNQGDFRSAERFNLKQNKPQLKVVYKDIDQTVLSLAVRTFPLGHPEELKVKLLALILGGAMSSRLFISLRERKGLAYSIRTSTEFYFDTGYLYTQAGVPFDKTEEAIKIILREYKRLKTTKISAQELKKAKDIISGRMIMQMESSDNLASWYGAQSLFRSKVKTPQEYLEQIKKINASSLQKTAREIFKETDLNLALIGRNKEVKLKALLKI
ncbi:MAG: pitrilysin family protein [Patescibacteria group bacterium]|nr:pitrilysin family protein [Patescibacteria group bacterium]MDD3777992.1 pitrilysin family protein [Patescibacteria group bacterium]MDD3939136.1 pitrilysin family protein [Patescibacteria group bacterium]MDD4443693.1 pitrilysin family protein [Patescibacteria group bacterium]